MHREVKLELPKQQETKPEAKVSTTIILTASSIDLPKYTLNQNITL